MGYSHDDLTAFPVEFDRIAAHLQARAATLPSLPTTSTPDVISASLQALPSSLPEVGLGIHETTNLLLDRVAPALSVGQAGPRFFGLITGGVLPVAQLADHLVTSYDPCVQVLVPEETISTSLEHQTLSMLLELFDLPKERFTSNTFTTGATASNFLGIALGREWAIGKVFQSRGVEGYSVGESGFGGVDVDVFVAGAHASTAKSASMAGLGRANVHDVTADDAEQPCSFDLVRLEKRLKANTGKRGSIVFSSFGEVNTGGITPNSQRLRELCDKYDAWLHFDAAFAAFAILHPDFPHLAGALSLADSICSDAHKWLNVPYDCGIFFSRDPALLHRLTGPGSNVPAYLTSGSSNPTSSHPAIDPYRTIPPPLFKNIENSRRFRALPVWSVLVSLGREGITEYVCRNIHFARTVEAWMRNGGGDGGYDILLPATDSNPGEGFKTLNIVLFAPSAAAPARFQGPTGHTKLVQAICASKECYVTGTAWKGRGAIRLAVSNWATRPERDWPIVRQVLEKVMQEA